MSKKLYSVFITLSLCLVITNGFQNSKVTQFKIYPHDKTCYTQGLFFLNQTHLFQSCGYYNKSFYQVMKYDQQSEFKIQQNYKSIRPIDKSIFFQGSTYFPKTNKIYILTWRQRKVFKINKDSFAVQQILKWQKDGWGLTNNDTHMFATDGSATIYITDQNFKIIDQITIYDQKGQKVYSINELECVLEDGKQFIYANVYMQRRIIKIDIKEGKVVREYDLLKVIQNEKQNNYDEVLNGIAYDKKSKKFVLTGKNWKNFYLVKLN